MFTYHMFAFKGATTRPAYVDYTRYVHYSTACANNVRVHNRLVNVETLCRIMEVDTQSTSVTALAGPSVIAETEGSSG